MARGLKFWISEVEELYYQCSENKDADRGYREAGLRLCFCMCKKPVFSRRGSFLVLPVPHEPHELIYAFLKAHMLAHVVLHGGGNLRVMGKPTTVDKQPIPWDN